MPPRVTDVAVYFRRTRLEGDCLIWAGAKGGLGVYGCVKVGGKRLPVHRRVYEMLRGPVSSDLEIDHVCGQPLCINIDHLEAVSQQTNLARSNTPAAINSRKLKCIRGHSLFVDNLLVKFYGNRWHRVCNECRRMLAREGQKRYRAKLKLSHHTSVPPVMPVS